MTGEERLQLMTREERRESIRRYLLRLRRRDPVKYVKLCNRIDRAIEKEKARPGVLTGIIGRLFGRTKA